MRTRYLAALVWAASWLFASSLNAEWISLGEPAGNAPEVEVLQDDGGSVILEFRVGGYFLDEVDIEGDSYAIISLPKNPIFLEKGFPELPRINKSIIIPDDAHMSYEILETEYELRRILPVAPSKGSLPRSCDPDTVPYTFSEFYRTDNWWPEDTVQLQDPFIIRDFRGITIQLNVFRHNALQKALRICRRLVVRVYADGPGEVNVKIKPTEQVSREFSPMYGNLFLNFSQERYQPVQEVGKMLIITPDGYHDNVTALRDWKTSKGIPARIARYPGETGSGESAIKAYIQNEYDGPGVTFILLVGDGDDIPSATGTVGSAIGAPADPLYSCLAGGDHYPDAFISRFSAETAGQVDNMVARSVNYERYPQLSADWYNKGTGVASDEGNPPDWQRCEWLRYDLLGYTYTSVDQIYDPGATAAQVTGALNDGRGIVNYIGHGRWDRWTTSGFSNADVDNLTSIDMLPFISSVACFVGDFDNTRPQDIIDFPPGSAHSPPDAPCFAEHWLRAGSPQNPTGAIAFYGSSISQHWVQPTVAQQEAIDLLVQDQMYSVGGLFFNGSCKMIEQYGTTGIDMFQTWHIFGDCSIQTITDIVELCDTIYDGKGGPLTDRNPYLVTCDVEVPSGQTLTIQPGALIYFETGFKILSNGTVNADGELTSPIRLVSSDDPDRGMSLLSDMRLQNGGYLQPGQ